MLSRDNFGRRHQRRLATDLNHLGHRQSGDDRLTGPDIALQQTQHAPIRGEIVMNVIERATLRPRQRKGQSGFDRLREPACAFVFAPRRAAHF